MSKPFQKEEEAGYMDKTFKTIEGYNQCANRLLGIGGSGEYKSMFRNSQICLGRAHRSWI